MPESLYNEMHRYFAKRLTSTNNEKWETFASFYKECDDHREKYKYDESLIGGLVVQVGSLMVDTSIKNKLQQIENRMIEA